jgi:DeoR family transcriptional regulator of aga operon
MVESLQSSPVSLPATLRRDAILALVRDRGFVRVNELSAAFGISAVTVRTDLDALESGALLARVHGGAVAAGREPIAEPAFEQSLSELWDQKQRIAAAAAGLVVSGSSLILDVGTTATALARALVAREELHDLVIFTNGLSVALELERAIPRFTVIVSGGTLRPLQHSLVNPLADSLFASIHADIAFIGCSGVDAAHGVTNINLPEAEIKQRMLGAARLRIVMADSSKIGQLHLGRVGALSDLDRLITGMEAEGGLIQELRDAGLAVSLV